MSSPNKDQDFGQVKDSKNTQISHHANTLRQYYELLRDSRHFRTIWIGEVRVAIRMESDIYIASQLNECTWH